MKASNPNPNPNPDPNQVPCVLMRACVARPAGGGVGAISKAWTGSRSILTSKQGSWALTPDLGDSFQSLAGKRVLSVGLGESGSDIPRSRLHSVASAGACRAPGPSARASLLT
eukprot:scaffold34560_cov64-Phaeocystis_antarctica.AAC.6